jgi:hypothetical protein
MDAFFLDPNIERLPPESTRLLALRAEPYPDGRRVRVGLDLSPFLQRPEIELTLTDPSGNPCGSASLVEPLGWKLELTLHVRAAAPVPGAYQLEAVLSYPDLGETDRRLVTFEIPPSQ